MSAPGPLSGDPAAPVPSPSVTPLPLQVIVVEDRPADAELMVLRLKDEGFSPDWQRVEREPEYRAALASNPDLVLSDWSLPRLSGLRALRVARELGLDIPFVIVSGAIGEEAAIDALHAGADDYVLKDRLARLGSAVRGALERKRLRDLEAQHAADLARSVARLEALHETEARLAAAVEQAADSVIITDPDANIVYVNPAFERTSGYAFDEVRGHNPRFLKSGRQSAAFYRRMWRTLAAGGSWSGELENRRRDGSVFVEEATITPVRDEHGVLNSYVGVERDVTRLHEFRDALDAVRRRREEIARAIASLEPGPTLEATAERITAALLAVQGAAAASLLLFENGTELRRLALSTQVDLPLAVGELLPASRAAHWRERAALGPWVEAWQARPDEGGYGQAVAEAGIRAVLNVPIPSGDGPLGILSVASTRDDAVGVLAGEIPYAVEVAAVTRTLLGPALEARTAVQAGRTQISGVIRDRAFRLVFQPIVDLTTGDTVGFEALTRFADGIRPDLVFSEARHAGFETELEVVTLEAALTAADGLPAGPWLSLNVSPGLVLEPGVLGRILASRSRPVVLEITEHQQIDDYEALRSALVTLGPDVRVAVDDAGAGVANFRHLVELRPDLVKMDMSLVRGVNADPTRQALVVGLCHFARVSNRVVIAEGIETGAERRTLQTLGVSLGQGYLFGRPAEAATWAAGAPGA